VQQLRHLSRQCTGDGIRPSPVNGVYESDEVLDDGLRNTLLEALKPLEEVSTDEKDWHPDSDNQVLNHSIPSSVLALGRSVGFVRLCTARGHLIAAPRLGSRLLLLLYALTTMPVLR
jgi:hypothetical protein